MQAEHLENAWHRGSTYYMLAVVITIVSFSFHPSVCCSVIFIPHCGCMVMVDQCIY